MRGCWWVSHYCIIMLTLVHTLHIDLYDLCKYGVQFARTTMTRYLEFGEASYKVALFCPLREGCRIFCCLFFHGFFFFVSHLLIHSMMTITCTAASARPIQMLLATYSPAKVSAKRHLTPLSVSSSMLQHAAQLWKIQFSSNAPLGLVCLFLRCPFPMRQRLSMSRCLAQITRQGQDLRGTICQWYAWVSREFLHLKWPDCSLTSWREAEERETIQNHFFLPLTFASTERCTVAEVLNRGDKLQMAFATFDHSLKLVLSSASAGWLLMCCLW